jgi:Multidrug resistance efflux pump
MQMGSKAAFRVAASGLGVLRPPVYNLVFSSTVTGTISDIYVRLGQRVVKNQVLARLGQNAFVAQLHAAQVAVDASWEEVRVAIRLVERESDHVHSAVAAAKAAFHAELDNRRALIAQAQANIAFARVTLATDRDTLDAVIRASKAAIQSAKQTEKIALEACQQAAESTPTSETDDDDTKKTLATCKKSARKAFEQAATAAKEAVEVAEDTVKKDQVALDQAIANAHVNLVAVNGRIDVTAAAIEAAADSADVDRLNAVLSLKAAEFTHRTALAALLVAERNLALTVLRAPHDGVVSAIIGTIGGQPGAVNNLVPAGGLEIQSDHGGLTFIQLVDTSRFNRVLAYVDETDIPKVHVGQAASFTLKALGNRQFTATVKEIAPNGLGYPNTANTKFPVILDIDNQGMGYPTLYSGMTGTFSIAT